MARKPYLQYKDSGVAWLGKVPAHWEMKRLKLTGQIDDHKIDADEENPLPYIGLENIESWTGKILPINSDVVPSGVANRFSDGHTLFGKLRPYLAKACNPSFEGLSSTELLVIKCKDFNRRIFLYLLLSDGFINLIDSSTYGTKMPRAGWNFIGSVPLPIPPIEEQNAIADFLDRETGRIDELVGKKRRLMALLKEKRTALISRTVTRGLPDSAAREYGINPITQHKDSGVEWLGQVPEHWEVDRCKWSVLGVINGVWGDEPDEINDLICFRVADFDRIALCVSTESLTIRAIKEKDRFGRILQKGDLLLEKSGGGEKQLVGAVVHFNLDVESVSSNFVARMPIAPHMHSKFWVYVHAGMYAGRINYCSIKQNTGIQNLDSEAYLNEKVCYPPIGEQTAIADFLDRETAKIDQLIEKVNAAINRLQEYRTALISAAVTGKIDVRSSSIKSAPFPKKNTTKK